MMRRPPSALTASVGVTLTKYAVETGMCWVFREQLSEDYGIDAHVEVVDDETVRGRLVALQIKSGPSYFRSPANDGWWFRDKAAHFQYWLDYSIPVVVVLVNLDSELCHWQLVTESTVEKTGGRQWKLQIPESHVLDASAVQPLRAAAEEPPRQARRPLGAPAMDFSAADLEVHSALPGAVVLPVYIVRDHDRVLDELVADATSPAAVSGCKVLVGWSGTGKTRALYEVLHRRGTKPGRVSPAEAGWRVWPEINPLPPKRFLDELERVGPRTIVWLNEAQRYLRDPSAEIQTGIASALLELLADHTRGPVLVLGTLWPDHWQELTRKPTTPENDRFAAARRLLNGTDLPVPNRFTNAEVNEALQSTDHQLAAVASEVTGTALTQRLAGAPDLLKRYETAGTASRAVIHAAMDARRFGHGEWFPATFLDAAARCYLIGADRRSADEDASWFEVAIADLVIPGPASGPMLHQNLLGYRLDDFLDQEGRVRRRFEFPPADFWTVVAETAMPSDVRIRMADGASARLRLRIAAHQYEVAGTKAAGERLSDLATYCSFRDASEAAERFAQRAAKLGVPGALTSLANHRRGRRDKDVVRLLRQAADLGDLEAFAPLAGLLEQAGEKEGAEAVARRALDLGSWKATMSIATRRDLDFPDEAEAMVYDLPEAMRWPALAEFAYDRDSVDDHEGAERLAEDAAAHGHFDVLLTVADRREEIGDTEGARELLARLPQPGTPEDAIRIALSLARAGAHAEARKLLPGNSDADNLDDKVAAIVEAWPHLTAPLFDVLTALNERGVAQRLTDRMPRQHEPTPTDNEDLSLDYEEADDEVAMAYATLAGFHARRGEFDQAESLAMAASMLGGTTGLVVLSQELLDRGNRVSAERLSLCAVNMSDTEFVSPAQDPRRTLAEAREDETLLLWGLAADGTTANTW